MDYDFSGWATRNNVRCSDGRTIIRDAFINNDGNTVPLVWSHQHNNPLNVLGHALLENRDDGVYAYCTFNDSEYGKAVKEQVMHGDITQLSIYANHLTERGGEVTHGDIKEVSLVIAGANPEAYIDSVIAHSDEEGEAAIIYTGENFDTVLKHSDKNEKDKEKEKEKSSNDSSTDNPEPSEEPADEENETIKDVLDTLNPKQKKVVYGLLGQAFESDESAEESPADNNSDDNKEKKEQGGKEMKHNAFENDSEREEGILSHADQEAIINLAKTTSVGSLQSAINHYKAENSALAHSFESIESFFPDYRDVRPGAPELLTRDQTWVDGVIQGVHKSPYSRIRTRQTDTRDKTLRGMGYKKGEKKINAGNARLIKRTTDPQTVYRKDALNRDDIVDITDFDVVEYQFGIMRQNLNEEVATAIMIGDGRDIGDDQKIQEEHIRPIWKDDDLYTIHTDVDFAASKTKLQGTNTGANFGDNYIYAEAIIEASLVAREAYKGTGSLVFYCTPHLLNVMLLARDLNGRRIYSSKNDLTAALNVKDIVTVEQFEGQIRKTDDSKNKKLLGIFVNLSDYTVGSTKGGEITRFNQFDIDFNQEKYLIETRLSGALNRVYSAIALEEDVTNGDTHESV